MIGTSHDHNQTDDGSKNRHVRTLDYVTWRGRRAESLLRFSCYRRSGRASRRLQPVLPRSSLGTRWHQTWGWTPWSPWTFGTLSFSAPALLELLSLRRQGRGGGETENERNCTVSLGTHACMRNRQTNAWHTIHTQQLNVNIGGKKNGTTKAR